MKKLLVMLMMMAPMAMFAQKFGHINSNDIFTTMPEAIAANNELEALSKQYQEDLQNMQTELQKNAEAYDKEAATLPANIKERKEKELQDMYQKIQQSAADNQQALQKAYQDKFAPIQQKILDAIQKVGQEGGFVYIFDLSMNIPYISQTLSTDVTAQVKAKLGIK